MIFIDRTHKACKSIEDFDLQVNLQQEIQRHAIFPLAAVLSYKRKILYKEYHTFGKFYALGMGAKHSVGEGGWRNTFLNSIN